MPNKCATCKHLGQMPKKRIYGWVEPDGIRECNNILACARVDRYRVIKHPQRKHLSNACKFYEEA